jgi:uncharacterized Zn-binding protein involved in type VI secretion
MVQRIKNLRVVGAVIRPSSEYSTDRERRIISIQAAQTSGAAAANSVAIPAPRTSPVLEDDSGSRYVLDPCTGELRPLGAKEAKRFDPIGGPVGGFVPLSAGREFGKAFAIGESGPVAVFSHLKDDASSTQMATDGRQYPTVGLLQQRLWTRHDEHLSSLLADVTRVGQPGTQAISPTKRGPRHSGGTTLLPKAGSVPIPASPGQETVVSPDDGFWDKLVDKAKDELEKQIKKQVINWLKRRAESFFLGSDGSGSGAVGQTGAQSVMDMLGTGLDLSNLSWGDLFDKGMEAISDKLDQLADKYLSVSGLLDVGLSQLESQIFNNWWTIDDNSSAAEAIAHKYAQELAGQFMSPDALDNVQALYDKFKFIFISEPSFAVLAQIRVGDLTDHAGSVTTGAARVLAGGVPASRQTDMQTNPLVPAHTPGLIIEGIVNVYVQALHTARALLPAVCNGHKTQLVPLRWDILVGEQVAGLEVIRNPDGTISIGKSITLRGDAVFNQKTLEALEKIGNTPTGRAMLQSIENSGKHVTILPESARPDGKVGNATQRTPGTGTVNPDGTPGTPGDATIYFNPDRTRPIASPNAPWYPRDPGIGLAHELVHAEHAVHGTTHDGNDLVPNDNKLDPANPGTPLPLRREEADTTGFPPHDKEPYSENRIRSEWDPPHPPREYY